MLMAPLVKSLSLYGSSLAITNAVRALLKSTSKLAIDLLSPFHGCVLRTLSSCLYTILLLEHIVIAGNGSFSTGKSCWSMALTVGS